MRRGKHGGDGSGPDSDSCGVTYRSLRVEDISQLEKLQVCILLLLLFIQY